MLFRSEVFSWFDALAEQYDVEKIKTIGDAYMVAGGLLDHDAKYTEAIANMALDVRERIGEFKTIHGHALGIHIGISSGPVVAGVIGVKKFIYDLWGNAVNYAAHLTSEATSGGIYVDAMTYRRLRGLYQFEGPEPVTVKGQRQFTAYRLIAKLPRAVPAQQKEVA